MVIFYDSKKNLHIKQKKKKSFGHILPDYFSGIVNQVLLLPGKFISDTSPALTGTILSNLERFFPS